VRADVVRRFGNSMRNVLDPLLLIIANDYTDEHDLSQILRRLFLVLGLRFSAPPLPQAPPTPSGEPPPTSAPHRPPQPGRTSRQIGEPARPADRRVVVGVDGSRCRRRRLRAPVRACRLVGRNPQPSSPNCHSQALMPSPSPNCQLPTDARAVVALIAADARPDALNGGPAAAVAAGGAVGRMMAGCCTACACRLIAT
jgi:hypothetical protein